VAVLRPILEYAASVWHHLLTNYPIDQIEAIQKRAINIIHNCTYGMPYSNALSLPVSPVSEHAENNWHITFLTVLHNQDRAYV